MRMRSAIVFVGPPVCSVAQTCVIQLVQVGGPINILQHYSTLFPKLLCTKLSWVPLILFSIMTLTVL